MKIFQSGINTLHVSNAIFREYKKFFRDVPEDRYVSWLANKPYYDLSDLGDSQDIGKFLDS